MADIATITYYYIEAIHMNNIINSVLSDSTYKFGVATLDANNKVARKWLQFTDLLTADGITSDRLEAKNKEQEKTLFFQLERMIVESFGPKVKALLDKEVKTLSDEQKAERRYHQQQKGSRFNLIRKHLKEAERREEAKEEDEKKGREPRTARTKADRVKRHISQALDILRGMEEAEFNLTQVIAELTKTYNSIK